MWTENEIERCAKTFVNSENTLESFCDEKDLGRLTKKNISIVDYFFVNISRCYKGTRNNLL